MSDLRANKDKKVIVVHNPNKLPVIEYDKLEDLQGDLKLKLSQESLDKLKKSIIEHGIFIPKFVWIDKNKFYILDGHQTKKALISLEMAGYIVPPIPYVEVKAKNKKDAGKKLLQINSRYAQINPDTSFFETFDIDLDYINDIEISDLDIDDLSDEIKETIGDDTIPDEVEPICKTGDLWLLGEHRLLCGDATKREDVEKLMDSEKADMIFTDPPYGVDYASKNEFLNSIGKGNHIQEEIKNDEIDRDYYEFFNNIFGNIKVYMKDSCVFYITISDQKLLQLLTELKRLDYKVSQILVWVKNNHVLGRQDYANKHELIVYGWNKKHKFYGDFQTTTWEIDKPLKNQLHPTMKPIELVSKAIKNSSEKGNIILDLFGGSGSTLIACEQLNRKCFMMEIDEHYCDVIIERYKKFCINNDKEAIIKRNGKDFNGTQNKI